jgi:hypothetical protein
MKFFSLPSLLHTIACQVTQSSVFAVLYIQVQFPYSLISRHLSDSQFSDKSTAYLPVGRYLGPIEELRMGVCYSSAHSSSHVLPRPSAVKIIDGLLFSHEAPTAVTICLTSRLT